MATVPCVLGHSRVSNSRRYTLPFSRTRIRKYLVVEEGTIPSEKVPLPMDPHARRATQVDFSKFGRSCTTTWVCTDLAWASGSNGMASSFSSWRIYIEGKKWFQFKRHSIGADQWLLGSFKSKYQRGSSIGHELDQGPTWRVETSEPIAGDYYRPILTQLSREYDCRCSARSWQMRVIGLMETIDPSRESIGNCTGFFTAYVSPSRPFLPSMQFECSMILQGTLGGNFDIFAATGESTAWVLLWKTRSRPIGGRGCPVVQFHFFKTAFDPRAWTLVVFWKENFGRPPQLIIPENEGGDNTNYPSPPKISFFGDPEVPLGPQGPQPPAPLESHEPPGPQGPPGLPPGWPPAPSPAGGGERVGTGNTLRERLHPRYSPPEPQLIPIPLSDGEHDDDQPPQGQRRRQRSTSRERVYPHVPVPQEPQMRPTVTPESDDEISDEDFTIVNPSSPSAGPPPSAEQRNRSRRSQRSRSCGRVYPPSSSHANRHQQPVVPPPPGKQQNQATQSECENSATVCQHNLWVIIQGHHTKSRRHTETGSTNTERKEKYCRKAAEHTAKRTRSLIKPMDSEEDDQEHQSELGTSSKSQTTVSVLPLQQGPATSSQGLAGSANSGDEDIEYSDMSTVHRVKTLEEQHFIRSPRSNQMTNIGQWHLKHKYAAAAVSFVFVTTEMEISRTDAIWPPCRVYDDHCTSERWPITSGTYKCKFQKELTFELEMCWNNVWRKGSRNQHKKRRSRARKEASVKEARG